MRVAFVINWLRTWRRIFEPMRLLVEAPWIELSAELVGSAPMFLRVYRRRIIVKSHLNIIIEYMVPPSY